MESIPLWAQLLALLVLLLISAFFSIAETSMMALNRYRLGHLVSKGRRGAKLAAEMLGRTEKLLGTILLGNNVANTALTAVVTTLAIRQFGDNDTTLVAADVLDLTAAAHTVKLRARWNGAGIVSAQRQGSGFAYLLVAA